MHKTPLILLALLILLPACNEEVSTTPPPLDTLIDDATKVEVLRLDGEYIENPSDSGFLDHFKILQTLDANSIGDDFPRQAGEAVKAAVEMNRRPTKCGLHPGVAFRFSKPNQTASFLFCFGCYDFMLLVRDGSGKLTHESTHRFLKVDQRLLNAVKRAFPDDPLIAKLGPPETAPSR